MRLLWRRKCYVDKTAVVVVDIEAVYGTRLNQKIEQLRDGWSLLFKPFKRLIRDGVIW